MCVATYCSSCSRPCRTGLGSWCTCRWSPTGSSTGTDGGRSDSTVVGSSTRTEQFVLVNADRNSDDYDKIYISAPTNSSGDAKATEKGGGRRCVLLKTMQGPL